MNTRIFLVDDDLYVLLILEKILRDLGYRDIYLFKSGKECLNYIHLNPHVVFLDYEMDGLNGLEVLKKIKDYYPGIRVLFTTSHEDLNLAMQSIRGGSSDFLFKKNINRTEVSKLMNDAVMAMPSLN